MNSKPLEFSKLSVYAIDTKKQISWNMSEPDGIFTLTLPSTYKGHEVIVSASSDGYITQQRHIVVRYLCIYLFNIITEQMPNV